MRLDLSRKGDYSIRAIIAVGRRTERVKARVIAAEMQIPEKSLTQVLANLVGAGILDGRSGPLGGYRLAQPAEHLTMLDILASVDGAMNDDECPLNGGPCDWETTCPIHHTWTRSLELLHGELSAMSVRDLCEIDHAIEHGLLAVEPEPHAIRTPRAGKRRG